MTDLERTRTSLQHLQIGTLLGLLILVPALLGMGAWWERRWGRQVPFKKFGSSVSRLAPP